MDELEGATSPTVRDADLDSWVRKHFNLGQPLVDPEHLSVIVLREMHALRGQSYDDAQ